MKLINDYIENSKNLFIQLFGEKIITNIDKNIQLNKFIGIVFDFGVEQVKNYELPSIQSMYNLIVKSDYSNDGKSVSKVSNLSYDDYIEKSISTISTYFGDDILSELQSIPLKSIVWRGLDINTCHILATTPSIKDRFKPSWVQYYNEREYMMLDLYIQSIFHYGYQYGIDTIIDPMYKEIQEATKKLSLKFGKQNK